MGGREEVIKELIQFTDQKCNSFRPENVCFVDKDSPGFQKQIQITYIGTHESKQMPTAQKQQCNLEDKGTNAFKIMMKIVCTLEFQTQLAIKYEGIIRIL